MSCTKDLIDMHDWAVVRYRGWWMGRIANRMELNNPLASPYKTIAVMPTTETWELACDAFLDFLSRCREGNIPRDVTDPEVLMGMCVYAAKRQR